MPTPRDPSDGYTIDEAVIAQMYEHEAQGLVLFLWCRRRFSIDSLWVENRYKNC